MLWGNGLMERPEPSPGITTDPVKQGCRGIWKLIAGCIIIA